jgi:hypothetical protein
MFGVFGEMTIKTTPVHVETKSPTIEKSEAAKAVEGGVEGGVHV